MGKDAAGGRSDFQFPAWTWDMGDVPMKAEHERGTGLEGKMIKLYREHVELELSIGLEGQEMCHLGQVTQPLWVLFFSSVK